MVRTRMLAVALVALIAAVGCSKRVLVQQPPRIDLQGYNVVGIVDFTSDAEGAIAELTTQRFVERLQQAQSLRVLRLGSESQALEGLGTRTMDFQAVKAIGEKYGVDVVITGRVTASDVRPNIDINSIITSMSASAEIEASLVSNLYESVSGATLWTRSSSCTQKVAHVGVSRGGNVSFDAKDPEKAYDKLVNTLVFDVTRDFRVTYARQ